VSRTVRDRAIRRGLHQNWLIFIKNINVKSANDNKVLHH
jgi:hypothetical protein